MDEFFTTKEVGTMLKLRPVTIAKYAGEGRFPGAFKVGIHWRIPSAAIEHFTRDIHGLKHPGSSPNAIEPRTRAARLRRR